MIIEETSARHGSRQMDLRETRAFGFQLELPHGIGFEEYMDILTEEQSVGPQLKADIIVCIPCKDGRNGRMLRLVLAPSAGDNLVTSLFPTSLLIQAHMKDCRRYTYLNTGHSCCDSLPSTVGICKELRQGNF